MENTITVFGTVLFLIDWFIRIAFIIYIPRKLKPTAAMAWLLAIFIFPIPGMLLYLAIGDFKLSKRRRLRQQAIDKLIETSTLSSETEPHGLTKLEYERFMPIIRQNKAFGKLPAHRGNNVTIIDEYQKMIDDVITEINNATSTVYIEYYIIALDNTTRPFFDALEQAVKRGVDVYVLFDALAIRKYKGHKQMRRLLTRIGVKWRPILPIRLLPGQYNRPDLRNHRKIVTIDDKIGYIGSFNMIDRTYQRKDNVLYDELVVKMTGPVVRQASAIFAGDWYSEANRAPFSIKEPIIARQKSGMLAQVLPSGPSYDHENNLTLFVSLIYKARKRVVIVNPYFVPDDALLTAVISAAQRGVEITIVNSEVKDQWMVGHAQRSFYRELLKAGVNIYLHKAPVFLHSKHITIDDDIAVIGSSNMDIRSFQLNLECVVVVYDTHFVSKLHRIQEKNIQNSNKVTLRKWKNRTPIEEVLDSIARLTASLQ